MHIIQFHELKNEQACLNDVFHGNFLKPSDNNKVFASVRRVLAQILVPLINRNYISWWKTKMLY